ncbi:HamA C-terminal domain-containing protein [Aestuariivirga sp.]|uniref:HamA C-terminal domain-containing protein n=1 Tax=Aestuariivirga sp. TaxID=2650926 RepID=UPI003BAB8515
MSEREGFGTMDLGQQLELLLGNFTHLESRLRHLSFDTTVCGERIEVRCSYVSFQAGVQTIDDFIDVLASHIVPFCLPRSAIKAAQDAFIRGDHVAAGRIASELADKAKSLFIKAKKGSHRSGEAAEILLYILNEWILKAPQIVSKMYLKTNNNMPVHGTDGIHARYDDASKKLYVFWGESKAHQTLDGALGSALSSIDEFIKDGQEKRELDIISSYSDLAHMTDGAKEALLEYLDPYSQASLNRVPCFSCLLVHQFDHKADPQQSDEDIEAAYVSAVSASVQSFTNDIKTKIEAKGLSLRRFEFFLVPVPSAQEFRDKFQTKIGWPND